MSTQLTIELLNKIAASEMDMPSEAPGILDKARKHVADFKTGWDTAMDQRMPSKPGIPPGMKVRGALHYALPNIATKAIPIAGIPVRIIQNKGIHPTHVWHNLVNSAHKLPSDISSGIHSAGHAVQSGATEVAHHLPGLANVLGHIL